MMQTKSATIINKYSLASSWELSESDPSFCPGAFTGIAKPIKQHEAHIAKKDKGIHLSLSNFLQAQSKTLRL